MIRSGRTPEEALMILVPEAYKNHPTLSVKYPEVTTSESDLFFKNPLQNSPFSLLLFSTSGCRFL
jgi:hypothetical protein